MHDGYLSLARGNEVHSGYMHPQYAESHHELGSVRNLPHSRGCLIRRTIPGYPDADGMGCYPLFACGDWSQLRLDMAELADEFVSVALVTDPFGDYDEHCLRRCFPDLVIPFKRHYVVNLSKPRALVVSKHHLRYARKALRLLAIDVHPDPPAFLEEWMRLHGHLVSKKKIRPIGTFSRRAFARQLATPGMVLFWAAYEQTPVAAIMFLVHGEVAYGHALGYTPEGYAMWAQYALISSAIDYFSGSLHWIDLMGVPGLRDEGNEGIRRFKEGWTRETRMAWFCGSICDREKYAEIVRTTRTSGAGYFPAYRCNERA